MRFDSFDRNIVSGIDKERHQTGVETKFREERELLGSAYKRAKEILEREAINPRDFVGQYGEIEVQRDIDYVRRMEGRFAVNDTSAGRRANHLSSVFEAIMYEEGELSDWFGPKATTILPSRYDDIVNSVDLITRIEESPTESSDLGLALDVTFANPGHKLVDIRNRIIQGIMPRIKYLDSDDHEVPRVVVGVQSDTVMQLAKLWMGGEKELLGAHSVQFQVLEEILEQLSAFRDFAHLKGQARISDIYDSRHQLIRGIYNAKNRRKERIDSGSRDVLYRVLREELGQFAA